MISVLVPVYNVEKYLGQCLFSIVSQTYQNLEIICVNDGSTDGSQIILEDFAKKDKRIKIIKQPNSGYGKTMNRALDAASGDYIAIVESDDFINTDMIQKLYNYAKSDDSDFVRTDFFRYKNGNDTYSKLYDNPVYDLVFDPTQLKPDFLMSGGNIWTGLYKRTFLLTNKIRFNETPGASYQDISFNFKVFACAKTVLIKNEAYYHYRIDNESSSVKSKNKVYCVCDEMDEITRFVNDREDLQDLRKRWLPVYRFFCYRWNYNRIAYEYRPVFLRKWHEDTVHDKELGLLDYDDFYEDMREELRRSLQCWEKYYCEKDIENKYFKWIIDGFRRELERHELTYVYGAGQIGRRVIELAMHFGINVASVLVSDTDSNPETYCGICVKNYCDEDINRTFSIVLVALSTKYMYDAVSNLEQAGFKCILPMTSDLIGRLENA